MIAYNFRSSGNGAGGLADEGRRELALHTPATAYASARLRFRSHRIADGEHYLLDYLHAALGAQIPRVFLTTYYVGLKAHQFVALTGRSGSGKFAFAAAFAAALIGPADAQSVVIDSNGWTRRSSDAQAHDLHARFGSLQFRRLLQEASAPDQAGKLMLLLLRGISVEELEYYARRLLHIDADGTKRLALPGFPADSYPVLPPNLLITATLHLARRDLHPDPQTLYHVSPVALPVTCIPESFVAPPVPPVGLQRIMLSSVVAGPRAYDRLEGLFGAARLRALQPSTELLSLLWRNGMPTEAIDSAIIRFVANSFSADGRGLFDRDDPWRNALRACDVAVMQRALCAPGASLRLQRDMRRFFSA